MLVLTGGIFAGSSGPGRPQPLGSHVSDHGTWPGAFSEVGGAKTAGKSGKIRPPKNIFLWVVYTHFNAFRAAIQKMKKNFFFAPGP